MDNRLALMTGIDFPLNDCALIVHQPTIKELSYIGETDFFMGIQLLCVNKSMYETEEVDLSEVTNFDIFMQLMDQPELKGQKDLVKQALNMLFPKYQILITPRSILFNQEGNSFMLDERNFESLQQQLGQILCLQQSGQQAFNPGNDKAREIAQKLQRARERVAAQKAKEGGSGSMFSQYLSVLTVGIGSMSLKDTMELTIYQLYDLIERYSLYINWDLDIRARLAGSTDNKPVENWMKQIH